MSTMRPAAKSPHTLISPTSIADRARSGRRLGWALLGAVALLLILVWLGPSGREIDKRFTPYGAEGPLNIMPEISIDDGRDAAHQLPRLSPNRPAPSYEIEPDTQDPLAEKSRPKPRVETPIQATSTETEPEVNPDEAVVVDGAGSVELLLPRQTADQSFIIKKMVRPLYPVDATEDERRTPIITVTAAIFLNADGTIGAVMITHSDGSDTFDAVVREALTHWVFEPVMKNGQPPQPRWLEMSWRFRSPYHTG